MNLSTNRRNMFRYVITTVAALATTGGVLNAQPAQAQAGAVLSSTNSASGNAIVRFDRATNGALTPRAYYFTGGLGTGSGLGSQGAIATTPDHKWVFVVNAGSNDISVLAGSGGTLRLVNRFPSGGSHPVSLTYSDGLLYVLNSGVPNNITGFLVNNATGGVTPIAGSTQSLSGTDTGPAQISIDPFDGLIVVTEKATQNIDVFPLNTLGVAGPAVVSKSVGVTPFGFGFDATGRLFVSEAAGGANNASSISSYYVSTFGILPITPSAATNQTAACWVAVSPNGKSVWTGNAGNANNVSGFSIAKNGVLGGLGVVASGLSGTTDIATAANGKFFYALENKAGSVRAFSVNSDGTLNLIGSAGGFGAGFTGLVAY